MRCLNSSNGFWFDHTGIPDDLVRCSECLVWWQNGAIQCYPHAEQQTQQQMLRVQECTNCMLYRNCQIHAEKKRNPQTNKRTIATKYRTCLHSAHQSQKALTYDTIPEIDTGIQLAGWLASVCVCAIPQFPNSPVHQNSTHPCLCLPLSPYLGLVLLRDRGVALQPLQYDSRRPDHSGERAGDHGLCVGDIPLRVFGDDSDSHA